MKRLLLKIYDSLGNMKQQPSKNTPIIKCSESSATEIHSRRATLHVHSAEMEGFFHECEKQKALHSMRYQTLSTNISIASERVAALLGLEKLIPASRYVFLQIGEEPMKYGLMTDSSPGFPY